VTRCYLPTGPPNDLLNLVARGDQRVSVQSGKKRVVKLVADGVVEDEEIREQMTELREREAKYQEQLQKINDQVEHLPSPAAIRSVSTGIVEHLRRQLFPAKRNARKIPLLEKNGKLSAGLWAKVGLADSAEALASMSWDDKRALIESVFAGLTPDGKRAGVYIQWIPEGKRAKWRYSIRGLIQQERLLPRDAEQLEEDLLDPEELDWRRAKKKRNGRVTRSALHLRDIGLP
jgi:hypothetical protein